jgi:hypothetical protein
VLATISYRNVLPIIAVIWIGSWMQVIASELGWMEAWWWHPAKGSGANRDPIAQFWWKYGLVTVIAAIAVKSVVSRWRRRG